MSKEKSRILARQLARELTWDELSQVSGGWDDEPGPTQETRETPPVQTRQTIPNGDGTFQVIPDTGDPDYTVTFD